MHSRRMLTTRFSGCLGGVCPPLPNLPPPPLPIACNLFACGNIFLKNCGKIASEFSTETVLFVDLFHNKQKKKS